MCKPNPCKNKGVCSIVTDTEYLCNCINTGYYGTNCEYLIVDIGPIPKMYATIEASPISVRSQPKSYIDITLFASEKFVSFSNSKHRITSNSKISEFTIHSSKAGLFWLTFDMKSEQLLQPIKSRLLFFNTVGPVNEINGKSLLGFEKGCYITDIYHEYSDKSITFSSTTWWVKTENESLFTSGIVYVTIGSQAFPILFSNISVTEYLNDVKNSINISIKKQPSRDECIERKLSYDEVLYSIQNDLFARDFIKQFNKLTPTWFSLQIEGTMENIHVDNIRAYMWNGKQLNANKHCRGAAIDESSIFLVYLLHEKLKVKIYEKIVRMITNYKFCLIVEITSGETHLVLPKDNYGKIEKMLSFHELRDIGWNVSVKTIGFKKTGSRCSSFSSQTQIAFGTANMNYKYKNALKGEVQGSLFYNLITKNGKQVLLRKNFSPDAVFCVNFRCKNILESCFNRMKN